MTTRRRALAAAILMIASATIGCESPEAPPIDDRISEGTALVNRAKAIAARIEERGEITDEDDVEIHALADDMMAWNERYDGEDFVVTFGTRDELEVGRGAPVTSVDLASGLVPLGPGGGNCPDCPGVWFPPGASEICFLHRIQDCGPKTGAACEYWCMRWPRLLPF